MDFFARQGSLSFQDGELSASFQVSLIDNAIYVDPYKYLLLTLSSPGGGASLGMPSTVNLTVLDNGDAGALRFTSTNFSISEGKSAASLTVTRIGGLSGKVSVTYAVGKQINDNSDDTATASDDFDCTDGSMDSTSGHCYKLVRIPYLWSEAQQYCRKWGGILVSIDSLYENSFVTGLLSWSSSQELKWV